MPHKITKNFLINEFLVADKTYKEIANDIGCSISTIKINLKKYNIKKPKKKWSDLIGKTFGEWHVIAESGRDNNKRMRVIAKCSCGSENVVDANSLLCGTSSSCRSCGNGFGKKHHNWKGYEEISGSTWQQIVCSAKKRKLEFNIEITYIWELFLKQERKCNLSGLPIDFKPIDFKTNKITASLDRIDSKFGYIVGNVQWVHKNINFMKQDFAEEEFLWFCEKIVEYNRKV